MPAFIQNNQMIITDQIGHTLELTEHPLRIVSLVPSQTEYLYGLGLEEQIVGQTLFCVHPQDKFKKAFKIGGTKKVNIPRIQALKPDIIIANKEENIKAQIEALGLDFPVWTSDIKTIEDAVDMMEKLAIIFGKENESKPIVEGVKNSFFSSKTISKKHSALYLVWRKPWMGAGRDTFINYMMEQAGFKNIITEKESRYPSLFMEDIKNYKPEYILLSSEPFPFDEDHVKELQNELPDAKILLVDGEMFSWYGSRLLSSMEYFRTLV